MARNAGRNYIVAMDFDGTVAPDYETVNEWFNSYYMPSWSMPGEYHFDKPLPRPVEDMVALIKTLHMMGYEIILWTCRQGDDLLIAKEYLKDIGVFECFTKFNENSDSLKFVTSAKICADFYVDDCAYDKSTDELDAENILWNIYSRSPSVKEKYSREDVTFIFKTNVRDYANV